MSSEKQIAAACENEPIHIPGAIQPHGFLIALDAETLRVTHVSANAEKYLSLPAAKVLDRPAEDVLDAAIVRKLGAARQDPLFARKPIHLENDLPGAAHTGDQWDLVAHVRNGLIILEGESVEGHDRESLLEMHGRLEPILEQMKRADSSASLGTLAAAEVRRMTGFDRVLIYKFDADWNGRVVAEDRNDELPSYLDLRFPAEDIPRQARELYRLNRLRLIATCDYEPVPILTSSSSKFTGQPLDLTLSTLRSVSPVHLQYMRNMGTACSMSVSIIRDEKLWGLVSCHDHEPKRLSFARRSVCELLGHVFSLQMGAREASDHYALRSQRHEGLTTLLAKLSGDSHFVDGLAANAADVCSLVGAHGFAIIHDARCILCGTTPSEEQVRDLCSWLGTTSGWETYHTAQLGNEFPASQIYSNIASGLLAVSISKVYTTYILWFRPEQIETVTWAGDPRKVVDTQQGLTPRISFKAWKETVRGRAMEWGIEDIEIANQFRQALVSIVLKRAEELAALADELGKANRELAAFSYSVSHDLRAPFRHIRSYAEILQEEKGGLLDDEARSILERILDASQHAGRLVDNLLAFAKMGRTSMQEQSVDSAGLVKELKDEITPLLADRKVEWDIKPLPRVTGDAMLLRQVWQNLLENALKYSRTREVSRIEVSAEEKPDSFVFRVKDNGVGFDPRFADKLFGVFQRLHRAEDFEGTGIGLANVRRIVERHGGKTWATGKVGGGAEFFFSLPKKENTLSHA